MRGPFGTFCCTGDSIITTQGNIIQLLTGHICSAQIEGRGNGIKTNVVNNVEIAKALERPPDCEFKSISTILLPDCWTHCQ